MAVPSADAMIADFLSITRHKEGVGEDGSCTRTPCVTDWPPPCSSCVVKIAEMGDGESKTGITTGGWEFSRPGQELWKVGFEQYDS